MNSEVADMEKASHAQSLCFWGDAEGYGHVECDYGQGVRLKTKGDSVFIGK